MISLLSDGKNSACGIANTTDIEYKAALLDDEQLCMLKLVCFLQRRQHLVAASIDIILVVVVCVLCVMNSSMVSEVLC